MNRVSISPGLRFKIDLNEYTILKCLSDGKIQVLREGYQKGELFTKQELIKLLDQGRLEFEVKGKNVRPVKEGSFSTSYEENYLEVVKRKEETIFRFKVIEPLIQIRRTKSDVRQRVQEINNLSRNPMLAKKILGIGFIKTISVASVYRWIAIYLESNRDIRSLIPSYQNCGGPGKSRMHPKVLEIIEQCIKNTYLKKQRVTIDELYYDVLAEVVNENEYRVGDDVIEKPSYPTMARIVARIPEFELIAKRLSPRNAEVEYNPIGQGVKVSFPLERVEIDATIMDIMIIFADGTFINRPYLVVALDKLTRDIVGFSIGFGGVGWPEVSQCVRHMLSDKSYVKERYPFINNEWNTFGVPESIMIDNGLEFKNNPMRDACYQLGVVMEFAPPRTPEWKGSIERFMGTTSVGFVKKNPGTTRSNSQELAEGEKPKENARIPFNVFIALMHKWIIDVYRQDLNRGARGIPAKLWEKATDEFPVDWPNSSHELPILLGRVKERTITNKGIELRLLTYNSKELNQILRNFSKENKGAEQKFKVKYDPQNIGSIYLYDHLFIRDWIKVPCTNPDYAEGLSEWEHEEAIKLAKKETGTVDIVSLVKSKSFLRKQASFWESKNSLGKAAKLNSDHEIFGRSEGVFNQNGVKVDYRLPEAHDNNGKANPSISDIGIELDFSQELPPLPTTFAVIDSTGVVKPVSKKGKPHKTNTAQNKSSRNGTSSTNLTKDYDDDFTPTDLEGFSVINHTGDKR